MEENVAGRSVCWGKCPLNRGARKGAVEVILIQRPKGGEEGEPD